MKRRVVLIVAGVAVLIAASAWLGVSWLGARAQHETAPPETARVAAGQITIVRKQRVSETLSLSGTVRPMRTALVATRISGLITDLPFEEGDRVAANQVVATIDVSSIAAHAGQAAAGVDLAAATVRETEESISRADAGVRQADARLHVLRAQRREALAAQQQAAVDRRRAAYMYGEDAVARADLDRADTSLEVARQRVASLDAGIRQAEAERQQARVAVQQAHASVARTRAAVAVAESDVGVAAADLPYGTLRAPFAGAVTKKLAQAGDLAAPGRPLLQIEDTDHLRLEVDAPEDTLRALPIGRTVKVRIDALDRVLDGRVYRIVPSGDPKTRSFVVKVALPPATGVLPGLYGRIQVERGSRETSLIPRTALVERGQLVSVFVVDRESVARLRLVKTTPGKNKDQVEVLAGLSPGERVVVAPPDSLRDGTPLRTDR